MDAGYFITGTDTDCGKTIITLGLMHCFQSEGFAVVGMKPVASGSNSTSSGLINADAAQILEQSTSQPDYDWVNPYAYKPAIAPHLAAQRCGREIQIGVIAECYRKLSLTADVVLVEGVGGWNVPLSDRYLVADIPVELVTPVIMVVGVRLGCINHALLTQNAIKASGCTLVGWIANTIDPAMQEFEGNLQTLKKRVLAPLLGVVPYLTTPSPQQVGKHLKLPVSVGHSSSFL